MLNLPANWPFMSHLAVAAHLFHQLDDPTARRNFMRCFIWAILDLANEDRISRGRPRVDIIEEPEFTWHEKDMTYHLLPKARRIPFETILKQYQSNLWLITSPQGRRYVKRALNGVRSENLEVFSLAQFVRLRVFFTCLGTHWSQADSCRLLYDCFNYRARELRLRDMAVNAPWVQC